MTTEHLSDQQIARLEALHAAREVGRTTTGAFGGAKPPDIPELVDLAEYIIAGVHPMDRYDKEVKPDGDQPEDDA
jgi:hypothetical protein